MLGPEAELDCSRKRWTMLCRSPKPTMYNKNDEEGEKETFVMGLVYDITSKDISKPTNRLFCEQEMVKCFVCRDVFTVNVRENDCKEE